MIEVAVVLALTALLAWHLTRLLPEFSITIVADMRQFEAALREAGLAAERFAEALRRMRV